MAPAATNVVAAQAAPIVLGADVSQTLIQNTIIEAQLASCPYGDSPLLKLISTDSLKKADMPNPTRSALISLTKLSNLDSTAHGFYLISL